MKVNSLRPRRMRRTQLMRYMVAENFLTVDDLIYPIFVVPGENVKEEIPSMPDVYHLSVDNAVNLAREVRAIGIPAIEIFGLPAYKDEIGSSAWDPESPVQRAIREIRLAVPEMVIISDVCLCQYTKHGHCGQLENTEAHDVDNDATLELLAKVAISHAEAGADIVAPSDMMDGRVHYIREALDAAGFNHVAIMSYTVKYASAFYGPFRDAAESAPRFGDRRSYQMDYANSREALKELELDLEEGADFVMVKPALSYLDIVHQVRQNSNRPVVAYNVSGEYSMVKAAAKAKLIDEKKMVLEILTSIKRAGADVIISYHAMDAARWLQHEERDKERFRQRVLERSRIL